MALRPGNIKDPYHKTVGYLAQMAMIERYHVPKTRPIDNKRVKRKKVGINTKIRTKCTMKRKSVIILEKLK